MKKIIGLVMIIAAAFSCSSTSKNTSAQMVGNDSDSHGCKASAGYTWSVLKNDCVRLFEQGVQLVPQNKPGSTSAAYVIFNDDKSRAEFFGLDGKSVMLQKSKDQLSWVSISAGIMVKSDGVRFIAEDAGQNILYVETARPK